MPNSAFIIQMQDTLTNNDFLQIKVIDNGDGTRSLRFIEQDNTGLPGRASQVAATRDSLLAGSASSIAIGATITDGTSGSVLFVGAGGTLAEDNTVFFWDNANNRLGIGTNAPSQALHVSPGNFLLSGTMALFGAAINANTVIAINPATIAPTGSFIGFNLTTGITASQSFTGVNVNVFTSTNPYTSAMTGVAAFVAHSQTGAAITLIGGDFQGAVDGAGSATNAFGIRTVARLASAGTITNASGIQIKGQITNAAGVITNLRGVEISTWNKTGTATNSFGILIDNSLPNTAASQHWAFHSLSTAKSLFVGSVIIGGSAASVIGTNGVGVLSLSNSTPPTTAVADGSQFYNRDVAAGDSNSFSLNELGEEERVTGLSARVTTQFDKTNDTLANVTGLTRNVEAGKTYSFRAVLFTTSNAAAGVKAAIAGTATATAIIYEGLTTNAGLTTQSRATALGTAVGAVTAVTAAIIIIEGTITVNAAGTLTVQFAQNVTNAVASSVLVGSTLTIRQIQ